MVNREGQLLNTIGFFFRCLNADRTQFTQLTAISSSDAQAGNAQATCSTHGVDDVSRIAGGAQSNQQTLSALSIGVNLLGKDQSAAMSFANAVHRALWLTSEMAGSACCS